MSDRSIPGGWEVKIAFDCFSQVSAVNKKVKTKECNSVGDYPVIDQGQGLIAGYIDDKTKLIQVDDPLIVFGDHTRAVKWVDFDFVPGADGTKILSPHRFFLERFAYHQLVSLEIPDKGYSRHFKFFKELDLVIPALAEQKVTLISSIRCWLRWRRLKRDLIVFLIFLNVFDSLCWRLRLVGG